MRLYAAVIPPPAVLKELADVVNAAGPNTPELAATPFEQMHLPITNFGNVTLADARALEAALGREAATWPAPEVRFAGGTALEWRGDESVWAKLDGEVDALMRVGRSVPVVVQRLGFFVDRRQFRPWLSVGTITDATTAPYLERLVGALESFQGMPWTVEQVTVLRRLPVLEDGSDGGSEIVEQLPLARS